MSLADTLLSAEAGQSVTQTANQLVPTSPVAKKRSVDQPIRTESTESITDFSLFRETLVPVAKKISW